ncbi:unnamed protein product, partial [Musa hybrid cultivar]
MILVRKVNKSLFPSSTAARTRESVLMARDDDHWVIDDANHERLEVVMLLLVKCGRRNKAMWNQMRHQQEMVPRIPRLASLGAQQEQGRFRSITRFLCLASSVF